MPDSNRPGGTAPGGTGEAPRYDGPPATPATGNSTVGNSTAGERPGEQATGHDAEHPGTAGGPNEGVPDLSAVPVRPLSWSRVEQVGPQRLRVHFVSGAPPCSVLAGVEVTETSSTVEIRLVEGREPDADCDGPVPAIGAPRYTTVELDEPVGERSIIP